MKLSDIPFDDPATFELLSRGETLGVFQVESPGMAGLLRSVRPSSLDDISAVLALYRPGPLDNGSHSEYARRKVRGSADVDIHPELNGDLEPILRETYGLIVYQEQVMEIIARVTGWSYAEAEDIFTAMRKKKLAKMEQSKPLFWSAGQSKGFSSSAIQALWDILIPFSDYSFNKSHSLGYAYLTYRGAFLKTHHPDAYLSALLTRSSDTEELGQFVAEARRMSIPVLPPDVNESHPEFKPTENGIRYGLQSIKGVGESAAQAIFDQRPYHSIDEFFRRSDPSVLNARVLEALIRSGSVDSLWSDRYHLLREAPELARLALRHRREAARGQRTAFYSTYTPGGPGSSSDASWSPQEDRRRRVADERELTGADFSVGRMVLHLSRPLSEIEWTWVKQILGQQQQLQPVYATISRTEFRLPVSSAASYKLGEYMAGLGIEMEEA